MSGRGRTGGGGGSAAALSDQQQTVILFGDSITAYNTAGTGPNIFSGCTENGYFSWGNALFDGSMTLVANAGISGNNTRDMLQRVDADVLAYPSTGVIYLAGTNDYGLFSATGELGTGPNGTGGTIANTKAIAAKVTGAGRWFGVIIPYPRSADLSGGGQLTTMQNQWAYINWLRTWALTTPNVYLLADCAAGLTEPNSYSPTGTTCAWLANSCSETVNPQIHPNNNGAFLGGLLLEAGFRSRFKPRRWTNTSAAQVYGVDPSEILDDPFLLTATVAAAGAGVSGVYPGGWSTKDAPVNATVVASVGTEALGGKSLNLAINSSGAGSMAVQLQVPYSRLNTRLSANGYLFEFGGRVRIAAGGVVRRASYVVNTPGGDPLNYGLNALSSGNAINPQPLSIPAGGANLVVRNTPMVISTASPNGGVFPSWGMVLSCEVHWTGAGTSTVSFSQISVRATPR